MTAEGRATLLRVFIGEIDRVRGTPLHEAIVHAAREQGISGATVLRGVASYGASAQLHTAKVLRLGENLPIVIEVVDEAGRIGRFRRRAEELIEEAGSGGLITTELVQATHIAPRGR